MSRSVCSHAATLNVISDHTSQATCTIAHNTRSIRFGFCVTQVTCTRLHVTCNRQTAASSERTVASDGRLPTTATYCCSSHEPSTASSQYLTATAAARAALSRCWSDWIKGHDTLSTVDRRARWWRSDRPQCYYVARYQLFYWTMAVAVTLVEYSSSSSSQGSHGINVVAWPWRPGQWPEQPVGGTVYRNETPDCIYSYRQHIISYAHRETWVSLTHHHSELTAGQVLARVAIVSFTSSVCSHY